MPYSDTKAHYHLLDALRGVAALLVLWHHVYEGFDFAGGVGITCLNHGYLAVDFFFILSGFVIGYAYDDRWDGHLSLGGFFRRRLVRLHPMVALCAVIGVVTFLLQGGVSWDGRHATTEAVMLALLCMMCFVPAVPGCGYEVRGNGEMFPLNGPCWSLFFEYIGNVLYALCLRRLPTRLLAVFCALCGLGLAWVALTDVVGYGCLGVGWTLDGYNFVGGLLRMLFPFTVGLLMSRQFRPWRVRGAFWLCSLALALLFAVPQLTGTASLGGVTVIHNGIYEVLCIAVAFPLLVQVGASGTATDRSTTALCHFLGEISYPLYVVHYPLMYLFYAWLIDNKYYTLRQTWPVAVTVCLASILLAYAALRLYDLPVRRRLARRFVNTPHAQ